MKHESIEINSALLILLTLVVISIGGLVEIVPLFHIKGTVEKVEGFTLTHRLSNWVVMCIRVKAATFAIHR